MNQYIPFILGGIGFFFIAMSYIVGCMEVGHFAVNRLVAIVLLLAGALFLLGGLVSFFLRDEFDFWD
jgi:hypothetical protein